MTSARERAVEAGARSDAEFDGRDWNGMSQTFLAIRSLASPAPKGET